MRSDLPRLGLFLAYWPWLSAADQLELAMLADEGGLDSVWVAEAWGQEAVATLGWLAGRTTRIALGSGLMQIPARKATTAAMAAATIDVLSDGRLRLGLGVSGPQVSENWYGEPFGQPLRRTREYVATVREVLEGRPVSLAGQRPIKLLASPVQERVPVYLGALGPKAIDQCYEIADGWLPFLMGLDMLSERRRPNRAFDISPVVPVAVAATTEEARDALRPWLSFYLGAMGTPQKHFLVETAERAGHGGSARDVQRTFLSGDRDAARAALTDALIDAAAIATTPARLGGRLKELKDAGADSVIAVPQGDRLAAAAAIVELL